MKPFLKYVFLVGVASLLVASICVQECAAEHEHNDEEDETLPEHFHVQSPVPKRQTQQKVKRDKPYYEPDSDEEPGPPIGFFSAGPGKAGQHEKAKRSPQPAPCDKVKRSPQPGPYQKAKRSPKPAPCPKSA